MYVFVRSILRVISVYFLNKSIKKSHCTFMECRPYDSEYTRKYIKRIYKSKAYLYACARLAVSVRDVG